MSIENKKQRKRRNKAIGYNRKKKRSYAGKKFLEKYLSKNHKRYDEYEIYDYQCNICGESNNAVHINGIFNEYLNTHKCTTNMDYCKDCNSFHKAAYINGKFYYFINPPC